MSTNITIRSFLYTIIHAILFLMACLTSWYEPIVYMLIGVLLVQVLDKMGKGIVLRETVALFACFITILMPLIGYLVYNENNRMAKIWFRYMRVPEATYFDYALPAMTGFVLMLCLPIYKKQTADEGESLFKQFNSIKTYFKQHHKQGVWLVAVGLSFAILSSFLPSALQYIGNLFYFSSFAGILYVYYSKGMKYRKYILITFVLFTFWYVLRSGMFTILAYMGMTIFSFFFLGSKAGLLRKILVFVLSFFSLLLIQSVKQSYRQFVWKGQYEGSRGELFTNLLLTRISSENNDFFSESALFPIYYRANQGLNISIVMQRIPAMQPFDGGANLSRSLAASVIPRVLWPDKPLAGGKFNMKYYAGITISGWSTNVGPLGEAYGSFGVTGGIVFMMVLGMFIRWAYKRVFIIARNIPLLICWLPVLFYQITYSAEADTLQILNSLVKSALFIWMMYKLFPGLFGIKSISEMSNQKIYRLHKNPAS